MIEGKIKKSEVYHSVYEIILSSLIFLLNLLLLIGLTLIVFLVISETWTSEYLNAL